MKGIPKIGGMDVRESSPLPDRQGGVVCLLSVFLLFLYFVQISLQLSPGIFLITAVVSLDLIIRICSDFVIQSAYLFYVFFIHIEDLVTESPMSTPPL